jgi:phage recombination protein Bet
MTEKSLALTSEQDNWTPTQVAALKQLGLTGASEGDMKVFHHYCQRTGLDPFARQIYMISRGGKFTIQSSIDGLRIVAQRSGNYGGQTPAEWCGQDGVWKDVWLEATPPVAARIGVYYKDTPHPTYAVAKWDSYNAGSPIWKKMPDLMLSKCAEALALRKAFPNDLSGIYTNDEMQQADKEEPKAATIKADAPGKQMVDAEVVEPTEHELKRALILINSVPSHDIDGLRALWAEEAQYLDISVDGKTLKQVISARVAELKENSEA